MSTLQSIPVQNIPGIGNVQVIPASALAQSQLALSPIQNQQGPTTPTPTPAPTLSTVSDDSPVCGIPTLH